MGKKSNSGKNARKGKKTVSKNIPQLPKELFGVIAEMLVGDLAFGTAASLNVICAAVQEETLPVLYETVSVMPRGLSRYFGGLWEFLPLALEYTKYLFTTIQDEDEYAFWRSMPRLVMVISNENPSAGPEAVDLQLFKPISSSTAAIILSTPVRHHPPDHSQCIPIPRSVHNRKARPSQACVLQKQSLISPIKIVRQLYFDGGWIAHEELPSFAGSPLASEVELHDTYIDLGCGCETCLSKSRHVETVIELMKLGCKRSDPKGMQRLAEQRWIAHQNSDDGLPGCLHEPRHPRWHLVITGDIRSVCQFIKKLGEVTIVAPELLQFRMLIRIEGVIQQGDYEHVWRECWKVYSDNPSYGDYVLPTFAETSTIMRMEATLRMHVPLAQDERDSAPPDAGPIPEYWNLNYALSFNAFFEDGAVYIHETSEPQGRGVAVQPDADN